jgi:hypothetical protein
MKNIRPFGWVIIGLNAYFLISFFSNVKTTDSSTVVGFAFIILMFWLAIMNVVLYVLYRVTGKGKSRSCPACASKVKIGVTECSNCGFDFMKAASNTMDIDSNRFSITEKDKVPGDRAPIDKRTTTISLVVIALICAYAFFNVQEGDNQITESNSGTNVIDNSWIPSGFIGWDQNVAYTYIENPDCSYSDSLCVGIQVVSKNGCPNNLYGEISIEDKNGVQIGYTNDTLSNLSPLSKGELIFDILKWERFGGFKLSKISCY